MDLEGLPVLEVVEMLRESGGRWSDFTVNMDILDNFEQLCSRVGKLLVGCVDASIYDTLFETLLVVQKHMVIDKHDHIGCSKSTEFEIEILDNSKPVCHDLRRLSKVKADFVDD